MSIRRHRNGGCGIVHRKCRLWRFLPHRRAEEGEHGRCSRAGRPSGKTLSHLSQGPQRAPRSIGWSLFSRYEPWKTRGGMRVWLWSKGQWPAARTAKIQLLHKVELCLELCLVVRN